MDIFLTVKGQSKIVKPSIEVEHSPARSGGALSLASFRLRPSAADCVASRSDFPFVGTKVPSERSESLASRLTLLSGFNPMMAAAATMAAETNKVVISEEDVTLILQRFEFYPPRLLVPFSGR